MKNIESKNDLVVGIIYRHQKNRYAKFCKKFCKTLDVLNKSKTDYIIVGDVNIDFCKYNIDNNITNYANSLRGHRFWIFRILRLFSALWPPLRLKRIKMMVYWIYFDFWKTKFFNFFHQNVRRRCFRECAHGNFNSAAISQYFLMIFFKCKMMLLCT